MGWSRSFNTRACKFGRRVVSFLLYLTNKYTEVYQSWLSKWMSNHGINAIACVMHTVSTNKIVVIFRLFKHSSIKNVSYKRGERRFSLLIQVSVLKGEVKHKMTEGLMSISRTTQ